MKGEDGQRTTKFKMVCVALDIWTPNMRNYTNRKTGCQERSSKRKLTKSDTIQNRQ